LSLLSCRFEGVVADEAVADEPFDVPFDHDAGGEPNQRSVVGEDPDDVGAAADLAVDPLERAEREQVEVRRTERQLRVKY
jgi:hypothetical protein